MHAVLAAVLAAGFAFAEKPATIAEYLAGSNAERREWFLDADVRKKLAKSFSNGERFPRWVDLKGVPNARDLGGLVGLDGRAIRKGVAIRCAGINGNATWQMIDKALYEKYRQEGGLDALFEKSLDTRLKRIDRKRFDDKVADWLKYGMEGNVPGVYVAGTGKPGDSRLSEDERDEILGKYKFKTDLDLRSPREVLGMTGSPLGPSVRWINISAAGYGDMASKGGKASFAECFKVFLDEKNYPIVFHCIGGADRTGSLAAILEGCCGVSDEDIYRDWELTKIWNGANPKKWNHAKLFDKFVGAMGKYEGKTLSERIVNYVLDCGFTAEDVEKLRSILLERPRPEGK